MKMMKTSIYLPDTWSDQILYCASYARNQETFRMGICISPNVAENGGIPKNCLKILGRSVTWMSDGTNSLDCLEPVTRRE